VLDFKFSFKKTSLFDEIMKKSKSFDYSSTTF